jgi:hypothetical protein
MAGSKRIAARRELRVSDHALSRWLQYAQIVDVEKIRAMLTSALDRAFRPARPWAGANSSSCRRAGVRDPR